MPNWPAVKLIDATVGVDVHPTPLSPVEAQQLESALLQTGMSVVGARQFALGQPVTHAPDRQRLARLVSKAFASSR